MSKLLVIFGATGQQGGSVVNYVLNDPELSQRYKIRAITRDVNSDKAKQLQEKVEVVQGDVLNRATLELALTGAHTIFAMTTPSYGPDRLEVEYTCGKTIADVAVEKGAEYIIFSTLPSVREISGEKYIKVTPFDAKAKAEQYIRGLPIKSAFYSPGAFMENFQSQPFESDISDIFVEGFSCQEEFGYFGPDSKKLVAWAAENARGRLSTFEEYFQTYTLQLA